MVDLEAYVKLEGIIQFTWDDQICITGCKGMLITKNHVIPFEPKGKKEFKVYL